ncbi:hypothetical protein P3X46_022315 [Hevea brasiliensis]|uniref:FRIGIDA-like protein n=1 Tax=Hevea brasiliensis TaxID=3981 RepID=A0ABQ9L7H0_HEVBR|nr:hypothetical protein P3X46_022315 [Hevea brasiliensis]
MNDLVMKKRSELEEICRKMHTIPEVDTVIDYAMEAIKSAFSMKEILEKVEKRLTACEEECQLEEYNRLSRGTHLTLKRAENACMVEALALKTIAWEKEMGIEFFFDGVISERKKLINIAKIGYLAGWLLVTRMSAICRRVLDIVGLLAKRNSFRTSNAHEPDSPMLRKRFSPISSTGSSKANILENEITGHTKTCERTLAANDYPLLRTPKALSISMPTTPSTLFVPMQTVMTPGPQPVSYGASPVEEVPEQIEYSFEVVVMSQELIAFFCC